MPTSGVRQKDKKRLETSSFYQEIANRLFLPVDTVALIWETSVEVIIGSLLKDEEVTIRNFGGFYLNARGRVRLRLASVLRQLFKEKAMEKYGVEIDNESLLMAKVTGECPACKLPLASRDPPSCTNCGTKPFEKRPKHYDYANRTFGVMYGTSNEKK